MSGLTTAAESKHCNRQSNCRIGHNGVFIDRCSRYNDNIVRGIPNHGTRILHLGSDIEIKFCQLTAYDISELIV